ncbi:MAG TPA: ribonuclease III domain-containing protein [Clostridia bacterium]|nr:ribonuclease III domain-containing protein [Clostridia bacterium]
MSDNSVMDQQKPATDPYRLFSPITLAFLGDAVFELKVRAHLIRSGNIVAKKLHKKCVDYVRAAAQAESVRGIWSMLTEEEQEILRWGRNSNSAHIPKNADPIEYRYATGLEALFGYLFLHEKHERIDEIFDAVVKSKNS